MLDNLLTVNASCRAGTWTIPGLRDDGSLGSPAPVRKRGYAIVIGRDVNDADLIEAQMGRITIKLNQEATAKELIWSCPNFPPNEPATVSDILIS